MRTMIMNVVEGVEVETSGEESLEKVILKAANTEDTYNQVVYNHSVN